MSNTNNTQGGKVAAKAKEVANAMYLSSGEDEIFIRGFLIGHEYALSPAQPAPDGWRGEIDAMNLWSNKAVVAYAEAYRWSSGRISIKQFKENIESGLWGKGIKTVVEGLMKDWEEYEQLQSQLTQLRQENERLNKLVNNMPR